MSRGSIEFSLPRPPAEVFPYLADLERAPEWVPDLRSVEKLSDGPLQVGSRYREVVHLAGRDQEAELEVTEFDPPRSFAHRGQGGSAHFSARFTLEATAEGTLVRHEYTLKISGLLKLMAPMIERMVSKNAEEAIANLQRVLAGELG